MTNHSPKEQSARDLTGDLLRRRLEEAAAEFQSLADLIRTEASTINELDPTTPSGSASRMSSRVLKAYATALTNAGLSQVVTSAADFDRLVDAARRDSSAPTPARTPSQN